jgi:hypothetical protein
MYSLERTIFWVLSGACMGVGLIAFGLGLLPFFFGAILALYAVRRIGGQGFWIALVSLGIAPISLVSYHYITADPATTSYPSNPLLPLALVFGPIVLLGLLWGYRERHQLRQQASDSHIHY